MPRPVAESEHRAENEASRTRSPVRNPLRAINEVGTVLGV